MKMILLLSIISISFCCSTDPYQEKSPIEFDFGDTIDEAQKHEITEQAFSFMRSRIQKKSELESLIEEGERIYNVTGDMTEEQRVSWIQYLRYLSTEFGNNGDSNGTVQIVSEEELPLELRNPSTDASSFVIYRTPFAYGFNIIQTPSGPGTVFQEWQIANKDNGVLSSSDTYIRQNAGQNDRFTNDYTNVFGVNYRVPNAGLIQVVVQLQSVGNWFVDWNYDEPGTSSCLIDNQNYGYVTISGSNSCPSCSRMISTLIWRETTDNINARITSLAVPNGQVKNLIFTTNQIWSSGQTITVEYRNWHYRFVYLDDVSALNKMITYWKVNYIAIRTV